ncbi:MAG: hypothetical protein ABSE62_05055 [Chthoniobacteraceae bacterium]|jgi:hypothetical protein
MAAKLPTVSSLVGEGHKLIAERNAKIGEILVLEQMLIALGAGRYCDETEPGLMCTAVAAVPGSIGPVSYTLSDEQAARKLSGDIAFSKLFDRTVLFAPCQAFSDVAPKLLTPAKARDLVQLCLVPGKVNNGKRAMVLWK